MSVSDTGVVVISGEISIEEIRSSRQCRYNGVVVISGVVITGVHCIPLFMTPYTLKYRLETAVIFPYVMLDMAI